VLNYEYVYYLQRDDTDYTVFKAIAQSSLDGHSQLRTMADGWHGFLPHAMYSISVERLEISETVLYNKIIGDETDLFSHAKAMYPMRD
jgi:hypothetical protein